MQPSSQAAPALSTDQTECCTLRTFPCRVKNKMIKKGACLCRDARSSIFSGCLGCGEVRLTTQLWQDDLNEPFGFQPCGPKRSSQSTQEDVFANTGHFGRLEKAEPHWPSFCSTIFVCRNMAKSHACDYRKPNKLWYRRFHCARIKDPKNVQNFQSFIDYLNKSWEWEGVQSTL